MYYDKEFEVETEGCPHSWNYLLALELKNIANELHELNKTARVEEK